MSLRYGFHRFFPLPFAGVRAGSGEEGGQGDGRKSCPSTLPTPAPRPAAARLRLAVGASAAGAAVAAQLVAGRGPVAATVALFAIASAAAGWSAAGLRPAAGGRFAPGRAEGAHAGGDAAWDLERIVGATAIAVGAIALALSLRRFAGNPPYTAAWALYAASVALALAALPTMDGGWTRLARRVRHRTPVTLDLATVLQWSALGAVLVLALLLRTYRLQEVPAGLWYDEADNLQHARHFAEDPGAIPVWVPSTHLPSMFLMPIAAIVHVVGVSPASPRLAAVLFGLGGVVATFLLARLAMGPWLGVVAALLAATMRWHINWSRIGMHGVTTPLFVAATAYLSLRALRSFRYADFGLAGAALGLGMWFYTPFWFFPGVLAFVFGHFLVVQRPPVKALAARVALMAAVAVAMAAPVVQAGVLDPDAFFSRSRATSVFSLMPTWEAMGQVARSMGQHLMMFNVQGDMNPRHNLPGAPMLDGISATLLVLGLGLAVARWRNVALAALPAWIVVMVLPGALTLPWESPQSLRGIGAMPAVVLAVTLAIGAGWSAGRAAPWRWARLGTPAAMAALLGGIAFLNVNTYFGAQARSPQVYSAFSTDETLMARDMVRQQARGYTLMASRQFKYSLTTSLLAGDPRYEVLRPPDGIPIAASRVGRGVAVYLEPREASVLRLLQALYPDGTFEEVRPPGGGDVLLYRAELTRGQLEARQGLDARYALDDGTVVTGVVSTTQVAWGLEDLTPGMGFAFAWTGGLHVAAPGEYAFVLEGESSTEVLLDERRILWEGQRRVRIEPAVGLHSLRVRGTVTDPAVPLRLLWQPPGEALEAIPTASLFRGSVRPVGLAGRFYAGGVETGRPDAAHVTHALDLFYYDPPLTEPYLAVWEGTLAAPTDGTYRFRLGGFGTVRLLLDGAPVGRWSGHGGAGPEVSATLQAGRHGIRMEYSPLVPPSRFEILWAPPGEALAPIPIEALAPAPEGMFRVVQPGEG